MTNNNIHLSQNSVFFIFLRTHNILLWEWNLTFYNPNVSMSIQSKLELLIEFLCFWPGKDLILRNFLKIPMCRKGNVICVSIQQLYVISMQVTGLLGSYLHGLFCICLHDFISKYCFNLYNYEIPFKCKPFGVWGKTDHLWFEFNIVHLPL